MYSNSYAKHNYKIKHKWPNYMLISNNCVTTLTNKVIQCAPLIAIGTLFSLFNGIEARYIPYRPSETTTTLFIPDDVKIVPIREATWMYNKQAIVSCGLANPLCVLSRILINSRDEW
ncbi:MAG: hypothetical protein ACRCSV_03245 [Chlamydiales bacterium]